MKQVCFLFFSLFIALCFSGCENPRGKAVFWSNYGTTGTKYSYHLEVKQQSSSTYALSKTQIAVASTPSAPNCDSQSSFVLSYLKPGSYIYTVYYGGATGPNGTYTGSFTVTEEGCVALPM